MPEVFAMNEPKLMVSTAAAGYPVASGSAHARMADRHRLAAPVMRQLLTLVRATGGLVRDVVYVTVDALRGRYDH
jgi:hypothetical protein